MRTEKEIIKEIEELGWETEKEKYIYSLYKNGTIIEIDGDSIKVHNGGKYYEPMYIPNEVFNLVFELMIIEADCEAMVKRSKEEIIKSFEDREWKYQQSKNGMVFYNSEQTIELKNGAIASYDCYCEDDLYGIDTYEAKDIQWEEIWLIKELLSCKE